ncbi:hypothetical protein SJAV_10590 [Sulfurisphaera javensis]|uniref:Class I SAM-dependent methyltransferase n=1 Tax=Sulfurisphaera javensis TaxID=2049879 RepID=A0AAT9GQA1_9CREN
METLKEIFNFDFSIYWKEAEEINNKIKNILGSEFPYALTERKRLILYSIVKHINPKTVVETGVGPGVSTTIILSALDKGILYSIDVRDILENKKPTGFLVPNNLKNKWRLYIGKSKDVLPVLLNQLKEIDIFLHDSEHTYENVMFELDLAWNYLRKNGVLLIDNLDFTEAPYHFSKEKRVKLYKIDKEAGGLGLVLKS